MSEIKPNEVYTTKETREFLKLSKSTIKRLLKKGIIRTAKIGNQHRILGREILRLISPEAERHGANMYQKLKKKTKEIIKNWKTPTPIMFYVYFLKSKKDNKLYIGSTNDLRKRFEKHNKGMVVSTKLRKPFELIYYETYKSEKDARKRESNLKLRSRAFSQLKKRIGESLK